MISKLRPPSGTKDRDLQNLYDKINELIDAVNQKPQLGKPLDSEGKASDIRIVKNETGDWEAHFKTDDGFAKTSSLTLNDR